MIRGLLAVISFLTIIPSRGYSLEYTARYMFLFPAVGAFIGLIVGLLAYSLDILFIENYTLLALIIVASLLLITGLHHTDALADFADGVMAKGRESKLRALRDPAIGSAGAIVLILYILALIIVLSSLHELMIGLIVSESIAKYSMVLQASIGRSAWNGMSTPFTTLMSIRERRGKIRLLVSTLLTISLVYPLSSYKGIYAMIASIVTMLFMLLVAYKNFNGVSGDLFGATNELTRLTSLTVLVYV